MSGEKTYVFRRRRFTVGEGDVDFTELKDILVEDCLSDGYFPMGIETKQFMANASYHGYPVYDELRPFDAKKVKVAECWCAYAGKKMAREIYKKSGVIEMPSGILLNPYKPH